MTRIFRSIRFNIFLGALIAIFSAIGTLLPQMSDAPERVNAFMQAHPLWSKLFDFFGLFNLYGSWWFMSILGLMAFDIVLCKLWNKPPDIGMIALPPEVTHEEELEKHLSRKEAALKLKPFQAAFTSGAAMAQAEGDARQHLKRAGYFLKEEFSSPLGGAFVATKHRLQRWGSYFAHIGLVVILLGALVKGLFGFVEMVPVLEGSSRPMQNPVDLRPFSDRVRQVFWGHPWKMARPLDVYVDKFTVKYYDGTLEPKLFSSALRVQDGDKLLGQKTIYVNDPLDIQGVRFYQASWGAGGMFRSVTLRLAKQNLVLPQRRAVKIGGTPFTVEADVMMPNFTISDGQADTRSLDLKNPAVRFIFSIGPHKTAPLWLVQSEPDICFIEDEQGTLRHAEAPPFQLASVDPILFSGIQVAYDPGFKIVLIGAIMWLIGMVALFYLHRRRLWVLIEPDGSESCHVTIGAWSSRGCREYEAEFTKLMKTLREKLLSRDDFKMSENLAVEVS